MQGKITALFLQIGTEAGTCFGQLGSRHQPEYKKMYKGEFFQLQLLI
jgi:hypothetical protein